APSAGRSIVAGVVMRSDLRIDGVGFCRPRVGGMDITDELLQMSGRLNRPDVRAWMLGGSIVSWFNVVDLNRLHAESGMPVICVSYSSSDGVDDYLREYFPTDWHQRAEIIRRNGERILVPIRTGHSVYLNVVGMDRDTARHVINMFVIEGRIPEPIRLARQFAAGIRRDFPWLLEPASTDDEPDDL
ncbi:MAG: DUF99 family protein, partial [Candidatus Thorarchaeota archaeon]